MAWAGLLYLKCWFTGTIIASGSPLAFVVKPLQTMEAILVVLCIRFVDRAGLVSVAVSIVALQVAMFSLDGAEYAEWFVVWVSAWVVDAREAVVV